MSLAAKKRFSQVSRQRARKLHIEASVIFYIDLVIIQISRGQSKGLVI